MFSINLFKKYCSSEWTPIFNTYKKTLNFNAKEIIFKEGDKVKGIYFIEKGKVKILSKRSDANEKIIRIACDGMILGHRGLFSKTYTITAVTLTETTVTFLPLKLFLSILKANPLLSTFLIQFMTNELRDAEDRMKNLSIFNPKIRIALTLIKLIDCFGYDDKEKNKLSHTITRSEFADMAGTTYETIIRTFSHFEKMNLIKIIGKEIAIVNEKNLKLFCEKQ